MIYSRFGEAISDKFLDENDALTILASLIPESCMFKDTVIFIDEFVGFTPQEYKVIEELLKVAKDVYVTICDNGDGEICRKDATNFSVPVVANQGSDIFYANKITKSRLLEASNRANAKVRRNCFFR